ncbi:hypothetical protein C8J56DRAFT_1113848 [Mycena floridula]|nr:hypothetical protein C8J56DRAFT_1113848 [Mycena floridula]
MNFNADPAVGKGVDNLFEQAEGNKQATERTQFLAWISCLDFHSTHMETASKRTPGTGIWFIQDSRFFDWLSGKLRFLWYPGNPGVGKTILTSLIIDHLRLTRSSNAAVPAVTEHLKAAGGATRIYLSPSPFPSQNLHITKRRPTVPELMDALRQEVQSYSSVYIVVDALDECSNKAQDFFFRFYIPQYPLDSSGIGWPDLGIEAQDKDIQTYIKGRILEEDSLKDLIEGDTVLETEIINQIITKATGKFLQACLQLDSLASQLHRHGLRAALSTLPESITSSYDSAMVRVQAQGNIACNLADHIFFFLAYAKRLLSVNALQAAITISMNPDINYLDEEKIVNIKRLTSVCAGLVVIINDQPSKKDNNTTQEYFQHKQDAFFPTIHSLMTITCLRYLSFNGVDRHQVRERPFGIYASASWQQHAHDDEEKVIQHVLAFLQNKGHLLGFDNQPEHFPQPAHLHYIAEHGLHQTLAVMLNDNIILLDSVDKDGKTVRIRGSCHC